MENLSFLQTPPNNTALLKARCEDFIVREKLGFTFSGEGEFVVVKIRKTNANTIFVGEQLAKFAGIPAKDMSYAGLKDRVAVTEQWFCLHLAGKPTPDFSRFKLEGVEVLEVTRHNRKLRIGSLWGNEFELLLRNNFSAEQKEDLKVRCQNLAFLGFPNYFMEQRFGKKGQNLTKALAWAKGEIKIKDRKKRSFYLSAARSHIFNLVVDHRLKLGLATQVMPQDILQLQGSHSWFMAQSKTELPELQKRLEANDIAITAPLIGEEIQPCCAFEQEILAEHQDYFPLMKQEKMKPARRAILVKPVDFQWQFEDVGLRLRFSLTAGSYATALVRELVKVENES